MYSYGTCFTSLALFFQLQPQQCQKNLCQMELGANKKNNIYKNIIQSETFISYMCKGRALLPYHYLCMYSSLIYVKG